MANKERIKELERVLLEILDCNQDKYSNLEEAIDAIYALAFFALPKKKREGKGKSEMSISGFLKPF